jgi:hypothetical protein
MTRSILILAFLVPVAACENPADSRVDPTLANDNALQARRDAEMDTVYLSPVAERAIPDSVDPLRLGVRVASDYGLAATFASPAFVPMTHASTELVRQLAAIATAGSSYRIVVEPRFADTRSKVF